MNPIRSLAGSARGIACGLTRGIVCGLAMLCGAPVASAAEYPAPQPASSTVTGRPASAPKRSTRLP